MENEFLAVDDYGVARIVAALESRNDIGLFSKNIYDLAFAFISPLCTDYN